MVPFLGWLDRINGGRDGIVQGSAIVGVYTALAIGIDELNFESSLHRILRVASNEDPAVAVGVESELQIENEVAVCTLSPD